MAAKKRSSKGRAATVRGVKDLSVRKAKNVKGGWGLPMIPAASAPKPKDKTPPGEFNITHTYDKASPV